MSDIPTTKYPVQGAYDLGLEMSLLLPSSAPASWSAAVHEAARLLVDQRWDRESYPAADLSTLSLLLFARTYTGDRLPRDVPIAELREALDEPADREPRIVDEIDRALAESGQGYDPATRNTPLWNIFNSAHDQYVGRLGVSALADDVEPPRPGPSPMRAAAARLSRLFADFPSQAHGQVNAPQVASGPLVVAADRVQIVTATSMRGLRCVHNDEARTVRVDGPEATHECDQGHVTTDWELDAARVRMAVARATGAQPFTQGRHQLQELLIASTDLPRHSDPKQDNVFLREPKHPIVGRGDIIQRIKDLIDRRR